VEYGAGTVFAVRFALGVVTVLEMPEHA